MLGPNTYYLNVIIAPSNSKSIYIVSRIGVTICQLVHLIKAKQNRKMGTFDLLLGCQLISDLLESWGESCSLDLV